MLLDLAALELLREYPRQSTPLLLAAINTAAKSLKPSEGRVALLQKASEQLKCASFHILSLHQVLIPSQSKISRCRFASLESGLARRLVESIRLDLNPQFWWSENKADLLFRSS